MKSTKHQAPKKHQAPSTKWITDQLPDHELTVLMRLDDPEFPVWPGFMDEGQWCSADGSTVQLPVKGWMHLEDAAKALDGTDRTDGRSK